MSIKEKLCLIQNEMKVPKNLYNSFGKYNYRNAETILETAKPICLKYKATLNVYDTIVQVGERYYVKAVAVLNDWESDEEIENQAFAREEESKKGMDSSQVTGATSSYARKYALNGLFLLDDVKDADTDEFKNQTAKDDVAKNFNKYSQEKRKEIIKEVNQKKDGKAYEFLKKQMEVKAFSPKTCADEVFETLTKLLYEDATKTGEFAEPVKDFY